MQSYFLKKQKNVSIDFCILELSQVFLPYLGVIFSVTTTMISLGLVYFNTFLFNKAFKVYCVQNTEIATSES